MVETFLASFPHTELSVEVVLASEVLCGVLHISGDLSLLVEMSTVQYVEKLPVNGAVSTTTEQSCKVEGSGPIGINTQYMAMACEVTIM